MIIQIFFKTASADGLKKFIESAKCHIDDLSPSFDSFRHHDDGQYELRYVTCCKEFADNLRRKVTALHADVHTQEINV